MVKPSNINSRNNVNSKDTYSTIATPVEGIYKDKGSKFLAFAQPVDSEDKAKIIIAGFRKKYHDARHHCYAYKIGAVKSIYRINDDGEPSGTAGKPIYGRIQSFNLTNILIVVVRYFGGKLLGTGGLVNAYKCAAEDALLHASIEIKTVDDIAELHFNYKYINDIMRILNNFECEPVQQKFDANCHLIIKIRRGLTTKLKDKLEAFRDLTVTFRIGTEL